MTAIVIYNYNSNNFHQRAPYIRGFKNNYINNNMNLLNTSEKERVNDKNIINKEEINKITEIKTSKIEDIKTYTNNIVNDKKNNASSDDIIGKIHVEVSGYCIDCGTKMDRKSHVGVINPAR